MRQRIEDLERERDTQTFEKSQKAGVTMSAYDDQGYGNKSYLSSEVM